MVAHRAYSFDPSKFHTDFESRVIRNEEFRLDLLHDWAREIATHPSDVTRDALEYVRFDKDGWLDKDDSNLDRWYLITLASVLLPAPHLRIPSCNTMEGVLPLVGWKAEQVRQLIYGKDLSMLPELYGDKLLHLKFMNLKQHGGWLDIADVHSLLTKLDDVEEYFSYPTLETTEVIREYAGFVGVDPITLLKPAYSEARNMLQAAIDRGHALFLSLFD